MIHRNDDPPDVDDELCDVCFQHVDDCVCRRCRKCGIHGDPACYREDAIQTRKVRSRPHCGLYMTGEQWRLRFKMEDKWNREAKEEADWLARNEHDWNLSMFIVVLTLSILTGCTTPQRCEESSTCRWLQHHIGDPILKLDRQVEGYIQLWKDDQ